MAGWKVGWVTVCIHECMYVCLHACMYERIGIISMCINRATTSLVQRKMLNYSNMNNVSLLAVVV